MRKKEKVTKEAEERGITLIALVITIIVLLILAGVSVAMLTGENGILTQAQRAKNLTENATTSEQEALNSLAEYSEITELEPEPDSNAPVDGALAVAPQISDGMTPVKYVEGTGWVATTTNDEEWYDYSEKMWANVVLEDATFKESGGYQVLDEDEAYSMLVWIPRYAYKITSGYHSSSAGNIEIVFIDQNNRDREGNTYSTTYPSITGDAMNDYVVHPAFTWDTTELAGFWVGKFESSNTSESSSDSTSLTLQIKGGVQSWRSITVSNIYTVCTEMNTLGNVYGLSNDDSVVDPHMMKNTEWGAVAYLAQSKYGKNSEVTINSNSSYYTGGGSSSTSYRENIGQSTTGNVTGIYDMSGGAYEYVAAYYNVSSSTSGSNLINADARYKDVYTSYLEPTSGGIYGDAVYETSSSSSGSTSWYSDYSYFPYSSGPFFVRGGYCSSGSDAGLFCFNRYNGYNDSDASFRVVVPVLQ